MPRIPGSPARPSEDWRSCSPQRADRRGGHGWGFSCPNNPHRGGRNWSRTSDSRATLVGLPYSRSLPLASHRGRISNTCSTTTRVLRCYLKAVVPALAVPERLPTRLAVRVAGGSVGLVDAHGRSARSTTACTQRRFIARSTIQGTTRSRRHNGQEVVGESYPQIQAPRLRGAKLLP